jgi:hypothetical protein
VGSGEIRRIPPSQDPDSDSSDLDPDPNYRDPTTRNTEVWDEKEMKLSYWGSGNEKWESTSYDNAARFVAEIAVDPKAVGFHECKRIGVW